MSGSAGAPSPQPGSPYGPSTPAIRRFLQRLAGLDDASRQRVVAAYDIASATRAFARAETALGESIARSDRVSARDALSGPLLQIVRRNPPPLTPSDEPRVGSDDEGSIEFEPIAEPALAAVLALLMRDVLSDGELHTLYAPFADIIPLETLGMA